MRAPTRRFLAAQARAGNGHGYLSQPQRPFPEAPDDPETIARIAAACAFCDEPEAIGPATVDAYTDLARTYDRLRHEADVRQRHQDRELLTLEKRMVEAQRRAKLRRVDINRELFMMRQMLGKAERGGRDVPAAVVTKLEGVEARLDHRPDLAA